MATLSANQIRVVASATQTRGAPYSGGSTAAVDYQANPPSGTAEGSWDLVWQEVYAIGTSATQALDFTALADGPAGESVNMVKIDLIVIQASSANVDVIHVTPNASNGLLAFLADASDILIVREVDEPYVIPCGGYATSGSLKALDLINQSGAATAAVTVTVYGRSA